MAADRTVPAGFRELWERYPWPDRPPVPDAPRTGRDSSGFTLLQDALRRVSKRHPVIMEIGAEFGGSTRKFLGFGDTFVVSVDPWPDSYRGGSFPELRPFLGGERGMFELFQTFTFDYRDRLATVREYSPAGPLVVRDAGVEVDLVYIDGDHRYDPVMRDLTIVGALFPSAVITGDDWLFDPSHKKYEGIRLPVQTAVRRYAAVNNIEVETDGDTWLLDPSKPFNLKRPVPSFAAAASSPARPASSSSLAEDEIKERLRVIERSVKSVQKSVADTPSRRLVRKIRSVLPRRP